MNYKPDEITPEEWDGKRILGEDPRSPYGIKNDKWDREDYQEVLDEVKKLAPARDALGEITDTAAEQMADAFWVLHKAQPEGQDKNLIRDDFLINRTVDEQLAQLPETQEARRFTRGDLVGSGMALVKMEPTLEILHDRERHRQEEAKELQKKREELMDAIREQMRRQQQDQDGEGEEGEGEEGEGEEGEGDPNGESGDGPRVKVPNGSGGKQASELSDEELQDLIDDLKRDVKAREEALKDKLEKDEIDIEATLKKMMRDVADDAREESTAFMAFGVEPGVLHRLPADVRLKYAAKFAQHRIRKIAEQFGRMKNIAFSPKMRWVDDIPHQHKGIKMGDDLGRILPQELARFDDEDLELGFLADWAEGKLIEREMHGKRKIGRGGIILCEDGSGSMSGDPEIMAKAVMLCLLNIAKQERREFHLIHFGSPGQFKTLDFPRPEDYTIDHVIEAAELFFGGGTDFQTPLDEAMRLCKEENARTGAVKSDIIFVTDGQCHVTDKWLAQFHEDCDRLEVNVWGVNVNGRKTDEPLHSICRGQVATVSDMHNSGIELKDVFKSV